MENKFSNLTDEQMVHLAQSGDILAEEYLIRKYKELVRKKSQFYYIIGADGDDVMQEGMIGLFKAIRSYELGKGTEFRTFADLCITRQIMTAIKTASRKKHAPLNESVSLNDPLAAENTIFNNEPGIALQEVLKANHEMEPEQELMMKALLEQISNNEDNVFSSLEIDVWKLYYQGCGYREIAKILDKSPKVVDNAIQRTKKKIMESICR